MRLNARDYALLLVANVWVIALIPYEAAKDEKVVETTSSDGDAQVTLELRTCKCTIRNFVSTRRARAFYALRRSDAEQHRRRLEDGNCFPAL